MVELSAASALRQPARDECQDSGSAPRRDRYWAKSSSCCAVRTAHQQSDHSKQLLLQGQNNDYCVLTATTHQLERGAAC